MKFRMKSAIFIMLLAVSQLNYAKPPYNLSLAKNAVLTYYLSGEYETDVEKAARRAENYLLKRIKENNQSIQPKKLAMVLDIDDTSLSNFPGNKIRDFSSTNEANTKGYLEANAPAIEPVLRLYNLAIRNGVSVFFISFRPDEVRQYTITNLQRSGYFGWTDLILPNQQEIKLHPAVYKTKMRKKLTAKGYNIVLNLGDQDSDLAGGYAEHVEKIPNPMYLNMMSQ